VTDIEREAVQSCEMLVAFDQLTPEDLKLPAVCHLQSELPDGISKTNTSGNAHRVLHV
jgi:sorbitol-specific phosphotransferase system component IIA